MYEIKLEEDKEYYHKFSYNTKNENGQILHLEFIGDETNKTMNYYVVFYIGKRKDGFQFLNTTGKDGVKSLIWAKNCIKDFMLQIQQKHIFNLYDNHRIIVQWDDNRRRNAYYRGLKSLKFYYGMVFNRKSLIYNIKK